MRTIVDSGPPLCDQDVDRLAARHELQLPPGYRQFLLAHNGGRVRPAEISTAAVNTNVKHFYSIGQPYDIEKAWTTFRRRVPDDCLPIARCEGGDLLCLVLRGAATGSVCFWSHEEHIGVGASADLVRVASSLDELLVR